MTDRGTDKVERHDEDKEDNKKEEAEIQSNHENAKETVNP